MRVWVIDNDPALLRSLEILLMNQGYDVECFDDPLVASRTLERGAPPDVLVLDYVMPGLNGGELLARCRHRLPENCNVIVISGHTDQIETEELEKLGMSAFLPKPLDLERLDQILTRTKMEARVVEAIGSVDPASTESAETTTREDRGADCDERARNYKS